jgi:PhnB protein
MAVKPIPVDSAVVIPRLFCRDVAAEIDFCVKALGATTGGHRPGPDGLPAHALLTIGAGMIMIEREWPGLASRAPTPDGSSPVVIYLYVENVDAIVDRAVAAGARILIAAQNQFWGDRTAWIIDPAGHVWTIATRVEETSEDQRQQRWSDAVRGS